ncbi:TRAP transporter substrate-binding protein [Butyricicoccus faecihominis]|uniref:TRAP transporter substrate-binding protein n=1 Tax=Butyricicoccus faecihominis TaxID=1712515 RepID=UPI00247898C5|nr:TRAP transporter substrate-binding protein [Butyricicoccus faecihominis]MCQ5131296.1 TRAP transporter substrate-binding protein [Butyricicoccus faecihominis]
MQKRKIFAGLTSAALMASLLTGCGGSPSAQDPNAGKAPAAGSEQSMVLRLANSHNEEHITSQACQKFADMVKEKTDGRIDIQCFFAGQLGDERSTIEQCQFGGLDFTRVSSGASAEFAPLMNALQMPYEYTDVDHLFRVLDGEIGQQVFDTFEENNLVGVTYLHPGSRNFFNAKKEIHTPADLAGMKIRVSESDLMLSMMEHLGGIGTPLPFNDTYSSIQTGVVDGAENNMTSYVEMSFYEVAPYWTYDGHSYMPDMILASKQTMDKLSAEDQEIVKACAKEASLWHREAWEESEAKNAKVAAEKGCTLTTLTEDELKQFQDAVAPMYDSFLNDEQKAIVESVQALA